MCHTIPDGATVIAKGGRTGPNLFGVIGRQAGSLEGFRYGKDLVAATMALDRVLLWNEYILPGWTILQDRTARWDRYGRPETLPYYDEPAFPRVWWWDEAAANKLAQAK